MEKKIILLNDHKTGYILTKSNLVPLINRTASLNIEVKTFYLFWNNHINEKNHKYIVVVRNPKEIIISGYLYHKKCKETWAINKNGYC